MLNIYKEDARGSYVVDRGDRRIAMIDRGEGLYRVELFEPRADQEARPGFVHYAFIWPDWKPREDELRDMAEIVRTGESQRQLARLPRHAGRLRSGDRLDTRQLRLIGRLRPINSASLDGAMRLVVRVVPRANRNAIDGVTEGDALRIRLTAPPSRVRRMRR